MNVVMALVIMCATFAQVGLGCWQAINVMEDRRGWVALTSLAQSLTALTLYKYASRVDTGLAVIGFVLGGVIGGQFAMYLGRRRRRQREV